MWQIRLAFLCGCALIISTPSWATDDFIPAPNVGKFDVELDSLDGHFSSWTDKDISGVNAARFSMSIARIGKDKRWAPAITANLGTDGSESTWAAIQITDPTLELPFSIRVIFRKDGKNEFQTFRTKIGLGEKLQVGINWTPDGTVIFKIPHEAPVSVNLGSPVIYLKLVGSTSDAFFSEGKIGRATTLPEDAP